MLQYHHMGMEGFNLENMSQETMSRDHVIDSLHQKFEKQRTLYQPNPEDFIGEPGFSTEDIKEEITLAKSLKEKWSNSNSDYEQKNKKISDVFEGVIVDQFCGEWMAGKAEAFYTADPDDLIRKVDCVIEFKPDAETDSTEYLGLGIDVTFSTDYSVLQGKLDDIWNKDVKKGKEVHVKYVDTENFKGSLDVCRVVLAANKETVHDLARLYKQKDKTEIDNHPFLANIISQIKYQLESYLRYAQGKRLKAAYLSHVTKTLSTFYKIYSEKEDFIQTHASEVENSDVFRTIQGYCDDKLKEAAR